MINSAKKKLHLIFVVPVIIIISVFSYIYFATSYSPKNLSQQISDIKKIKKEVGHSNFKDILFKGMGVVEDFDITEYNGTQKNFTIQGKKMQVKNRKFGTFRVAFGKVAEIDGATVVFYEDNKAVSTLISPKAAINLLNKEITFYDKVDVITQDKRLLTSDKVTWNNDEKYILAKGNCVLDAVDGKRITGDLVKTDIKLRDYNVIIRKEPKNPINNIIRLIGLER